MEKNLKDLFKEEFKNSINLKEVQVEAKKINQDLDKSLYLSMKTCASCNINFYKNSTNKYFCQFCYRAYCIKCCVLCLMHPETNRNERCCNPCYLELTKREIFGLVDKFVEQKMNQEIEERQKEERIQESLTEDLRNLQLEIEKDKEVYENELKDMDNDILRMENKLKEKIISSIQVKRKLNERLDKMTKDKEESPLGQIEKKIDKCCVT